MEYRIMPILKDFLQEELKSSLELKLSYERQLKEFPRGALVPKEIRGHRYYYLIFRAGGKVQSLYKGKLPQNEVQKHLAVRKKRAQVRSLLAQTNRQILFLNKVLHDRQLQSMP